MKGKGKVLFISSEAVTTTESNVVLTNSNPNVPVPNNSIIIKD